MGYRLAQISMLGGLLGVTSFQIMLGHTEISSHFSFVWISLKFDPSISLDRKFIPLSPVFLTSGYLGSYYIVAEEHFDCPERTGVSRTSAGIHYHRRICEANLRYIRLSYPVGA